MVRPSTFLIFSLFGSALANGCFDDSFPGGSCTNDPACMCTQKKYREAYFCCMAKKCDADVMPESVERQHTECQARNLDFTFDAEKVCETTSSTEGAESDSSTAQESSTGGAAPVTDSAPRLGAPFGVLSVLFMVFGMLL
uniref:CFEM domain-containing protein n=1 Tax=Fusarium oxysporum (strain Fo5176) TaxID=660025 RepID=A0A0D2Y797_FUSOF